MLKNAVKVKYNESKRVIDVTVQKGKKATLIGTSAPQIVKSETEICRPLTDTEVVLTYLCENNRGRTKKVDKKIVVKGRYVASNGKKPKIIPEIAEWHTKSNGSFNACEARRIVCGRADADALFEMLERFTAEFKDASDGYEIEAIVADEIKEGDIYVAIAEDEFLGEEGYYIDIDKSVYISAATVTGAFWATRTILQLIKTGAASFGEIRDYPRYPVRGFMLDVGRKPVSMRTLDKIVKTMAWYKMNDLQIHLNDNYIWLEDYNTGGDELNAYNAYEAFRLETSLKNESGESPVAKDYHYTKAEFKEFIERSKKFGVNIVPEIDVPAHALSFAKVFPEYAVTNIVSSIMDKRPLLDHLDVSRSEVVDFVKKIFDEYTKGENPVFDKNTVVHIGADEFLSDYSAYRRFFNEFVPYIKQTNPVRVWGGLSWIKDKPETPIVSEAIQDVEMNLWASSWADGVEMYNMGFKLINTIDAFLYIVPNGNCGRGSYGDYLDKKAIYNKFEPGKVRTKKNKYVQLPQGDPRMRGAAFAIWNDNIDKRASGLKEEDIFDRFLDSAALLAEKTWAKNTKTKGSYEEFEKLAVKLGRAPLVENSLHNRSLEFVMELESVQPNTVLFRGDAPYGKREIKILENGKLGFTSELYEYEFDFAPKANESYACKIKTAPLKTTLIVNGGSEIAALGLFRHNGEIKKDGIACSSFDIPTECVCANGVKNIKAY